MAVSSRAVTLPERVSFARIPNIRPMPGLIQIQLDSFEWFKKEGLRELFDEISPIEDFTGKNLKLEFIVPPEPFGKSKYTEDECRDRDATYSAPLTVKARLTNKETGEIDAKVAAYWKEHYDLSAILQRDWPTLGPKLRGKLRIYVGSADNYMLNDAVYLIEDFLKNTTNPPYEGEVKYGERAEHCWNGDPNQPNYLSRLHYNTMYIPIILERLKNTAPPGADLTSWRY